MVVARDPHRAPVVFVSYTAVDRAWAEWIAWRLADAGYGVRIQAWHAPPSSAWMEWMDREVQAADHMVAVLSPAALVSEFAQAEWRAILREDVLGQRRRLLPARIAPCQPRGILGGVVYFDLFGLDEPAAEVALLDAVRAAAGPPPSRDPGGRDPGGRDPAVPAQAPPFPPNLPRAARGALSLFLDRLVLATRDRYPGAAVERLEIGTEDEHLLVSWAEDGEAPRCWPVGAAPDGVGPAELDAFHRRVHARYEADDPGVESELVHGGPPVEAALARAGRRLGIRVRSLPEYQRSWDPRGYLARQTARLAADNVYLSSLYVPQRYRRLDEAGAGAGTGPAPPRRGGDNALEAIIDWLGDEDARLVLVLGRFGHGKSFLLRELARRLPEHDQHLVPAYIALRSLEKDHNLDALLAQHLAIAGESAIDIRAVRRMVERGQLVLLFDGFDELAHRVSYDRAAEHLSAILSAVGGRAKVVVSSRDEHFASDSQWRSLLSEPRLVAARRILRLEEFSEDQVRAFLVRLFGGTPRRPSAASS